MPAILFSRQLSGLPAATSNMFKFTPGASGNRYGKCNELDEEVICEQCPGKPMITRFSKQPVSRLF
jgi:hypothetical protein